MRGRRMNGVISMCPSIMCYLYPPVPSFAHASDESQLLPSSLMTITVTPIYTPMEESENRIRINTQLILISSFYPTSYLSSQYEESLSVPLSSPLLHLRSVL